MIARLLLLCVFAGPLVAVAADQEALVQRFGTVLKPFLPGVKLTSVRPSPLPGLYEVMLGTTVMYLTEDGRFALHGDLYDLSTKRNVTDTARDEVRSAALRSFDRTKMITFASVGDTKQELFVFTDVDCTYCRAMHKEIGKLTQAGITVHYLAFPRTGIDSESYDKAVTVWCSPDRQRALTDAKAGKKIRPAACSNPVAEEYELGRALGITGTPAVMLPDGSVIGGYIPADQMIETYAAADTAE